MIMIMIMMIMIYNRNDGAHGHRKYGGVCTGLSPELQLKRHDAVGVNAHRIVVGEQFCKGSARAIEFAVRTRARQLPSSLAAVAELGRRRRRCNGEGGGRERRRREPVRYNLRESGSVFARPRHRRGGTRGAAARTSCEIFLRSAILEY